MSIWKPLAALLAVAVAAPHAVAATTDDIASLRGEVQDLRRDYTARLAELEARIAQLEAAPEQSVATVAPVEAQPALAATRAAPGGAAAFVPAISLILAGNYAAVSRNPDTWHIAGFIPSGGDAGPGQRSFNLGESELTLAANVDPYFSATLTAAISGDNDIHVEEAFFRTLALSSGFTLKGGRFFSGIGYLNEVHSHAWDFVDQPLAYQAFFGGQLAQDGLQLKWLAPTDLFLEFGIEAGNGQAFPGTRRNRNNPNSLAFFAHAGGDIGDSTSWRAGVSWLAQSAEQRGYDDVNQLGAPVLNEFTGRSRVWAADAILKWAPGGNAQRQQWKLQGEYLHRRESGALTFDSQGADLSDAYRSDQAGWYLQSVFQFLPRWRIGLRYDSLDSGSTDVALVNRRVLPLDAFPLLLRASPTRLTTMLDWNPSEFSRLRAQFAWDDARDRGQSDRQLQLQYLYGIGAHGAHKY